MSILKGALALAAGAAAVAAYKVAREADDPAIVLGAAGVTAVAGSYAVHQLVREVGEMRRLARGEKA